MDYTNFQVLTCPPTAMYIPNFITSEEEQRILSNVERTPKPKWTQLQNRRLINYGGVLHPKGMISEELPEWLQTYVDKINNLGIFGSHNANHVLVNEYQAGEGIMPHTDGPLFFPTISTISCGSHTVLEFYERENVSPSAEDSVSLEDGVDGATAPTDDENYNREVKFKLLIEPRSMLILKDTLYSDYLHGISEIKEDVLCDRICNYDSCESLCKMGDCLKRGTRVSLTIRCVPKASKLKLKLYQTSK